MNKKRSLFLVLLSFLPLISSGMGWFSSKPITHAGSFLRRHKVATSVGIAGTLSLMYFGYQMYNNFKKPVTQDNNQVEIDNNQISPIENVVQEAPIVEQVNAAGIESESSIIEEQITKNPSVEIPFENFQEWQNACAQCIKDPTKTPLTAELLQNEIESFCASQQNILGNPAVWVEKSYTQIPQFFVQKLEVTPGTKIAIHGDIHGDIYSLNKFIEHLIQQGYLDNNLKIINPNFKMIFLGDYTDRGQHGAEVIFTILWLKSYNPDDVILVRGNHEDVNLNMPYGFAKELNQKFGRDLRLKLMSTLDALYINLPVALYLVSGSDTAKDAFLCCHGGIELGFNPTHLLNAPQTTCYTPLTALNRLQEASSLIKQDPKMHQCLKPVENDIDNYQHVTTANGFMWNDFNFCPANTIKEVLVCMERGTGWILSEYFTKGLLKYNSTQNCKLRGVFRAHQHGPDTMPRITNTDGMSEPDDAGVAKLWIPKGTRQPAGTLWDGIVCTFCVSPNAGYTRCANYNFDSFGLLTTAQNFDQWHLDMYRIKTRIS